MTFLNKLTLGVVAAAALVLATPAEARGHYGHGRGYYGHGYGYGGYGYGGYGYGGRGYASRGRSHHR